MLIRKEEFGVTGGSVKQKSDWKGDFTECFEVGDLVSEEVLDEFIGCVPPQYLGKENVQMGEITKYSPAGKPLFLTLTKTDEGWVYAGVLPGIGGVRE